MTEKSQGGRPRKPEEEKLSFQGMRMDELDWETLKALYGGPGRSRVLRSLVGAHLGDPETTPPPPPSPGEVESARMEARAELARKRKTARARAGDGEGAPGRAGRPASAAS